MQLRQSPKNGGGSQRIGNITSSGGNCKVTQIGGSQQNVGDIKILQSGECDSFISSPTIVDDKITFWFTGDIIYNDFLKSEGNNVLFYGVIYERNINDRCDVHGQNLKINGRLVVGENFIILEEKKNIIDIVVIVVGVFGFITVFYGIYNFVHSDSIVSN
jgi:hypothetical protein